MSDRLIYYFTISIYIIIYIQTTFYNINDWFVFDSCNSIRFVNFVNSLETGMFFMATGDGSLPSGIKVSMGFLSSN